MAERDTPTPAGRRRLSIGPALIAALVLSALIPAVLVSWLLSSNSSRAIETLPNGVSHSVLNIEKNGYADILSEVV